MAAVVPTIVASIEQKEATVVIPEVVVAKKETVVVIDEALAKKDYLPKSLTEEKVVSAVTEVIAEIATVPAVAPVVVEPVVAKTTEEVKKSEAPLVETIKTEDKPESSTASSSDSFITVL